MRTSVQHKICKRGGKASRTLQLQIKGVVNESGYRENVEWNGKSVQLFL